MIPKERAFSSAVYGKGIVPFPIEQLIYVPVFHLQLVTGYANNAEWIVPILDKYEFNIVPILNPDGYEYTYNVSGVSTFFFLFCCFTFNSDKLYTINFIRKELMKALYAQPFTPWLNIVSDRSQYGYVTCSIEITFF